MSIAYKGFNIWLADPTTGVERDYIGRFELAVIPLTSHFSFNNKTSQEAISLIDSHMDGGSSDRNITTGFSWHDASSSDYSQAFGEVYPAVLQQDISSIISSMPDSKLKLVAQNGYYAISQSSSVYFSVLMTLGLELYDDEGTFMGRIDSLLTGSNPYSFVWVGYVGDLNNSRVYTFRAYGSTSNPRFNLVNSTINVSSYPSIIEWFNAVGPIVPPPPVDPYEEGGTSGPGGGTDTDFDITGDTILDSPLPTFSFANSGFARIYNPNLSQLQRLANYLWTDTNFLQTIVNHAKQLLEDPIESIITLNRLPISVPNGEAEVVKVLYIPTNTSMPPVTNQFVDVDCGTLQIKHEYDSALDYNPYTDISLVLPFIGVVQLDPDEVMDKTLSLTYRVDVVSGMCVAKVAVDSCVLYQYSGNCAISMPFNSADFSNYISAMVTAAKSITGVVAAGAAGAMTAAAEGTEAVKAIVAKATSGEPESTGPSLPAPSNKSTNVFKETFGRGGVGEGTLKAAKKGVANTVGAVVSSKRTIEHAGHFSGNSGFLGVRRPYAIIKRPKMCNPEEYGRFNGRPCMMYLHLENLSGYTEVQEIHLTGILATNDELIEIENLLKSGVIM